MGSMNLADTAAKRRSLAVEWLNSLFPGLNISLGASEEELRVLLSDGTILCGIFGGQDPTSLANQRGAYMSSEQRREKTRRFLSALEGMGLPRFNPADLEQGSISVVIDCLLALRDNLNTKLGDGDTHGTANYKNQPQNNSGTSEGNGNAMNALQRNPNSIGKTSPIVEEKRKNFPESKCHPFLQTHVISEPSSALSDHVGYKFHEVFQLKQGRYSDFSAERISEILKSNGLDNAPTQSLLSVINGILDESIRRKNGEIPLRVGHLLRKVIQEIERRISTQAEHIRNQNNLIKSREEKYQSRIRALETLASGTNEETQIVSNQLQIVKAQKSTIEESKKHDEEHAVKLMKEKEGSDQMIIGLQQDLEKTKKVYEHRCQQLELEAKQNDAKLKERIKEVEFLLSESNTRIKELEAFAESKFENWNKKENVLQTFIGFQLPSIKRLRISSESIKLEVIDSQRKWSEEMNNMGIKLKVLVDAAENYHAVLTENRKLYNEVQELKGNIRVYCRVRPFLAGQNTKSNTVDYIGENGEILLVNPSKQGKDGHRMFKFNQVFGPTATQAQVFLDIQPLIRSVLDGYNVCIFAYGQTGSGKTYTMGGPYSPSKEEWGVNYRALSDLFHISQARKNAFTYEIGVQMVEIYNEQVRDLLSNSGPQKRLGIWSSSQPNGLAVPDASMVPVNSTSDVLDLMQYGQTNRAVGATALNERSSRSHSILTVHVRAVDLKTGSSSRACLHLIDLAGSERVERSEATGDRLKEAQYINKSLSALGDVIFALSQKSTHVPYRNSKLTQVLQSSLGGQAKTLMFVQVNPDGESYSETLSTLKFAERVSGVELGAAKSNKEGKDVRDLIEQVSSLKDTIARKDDEIEQLQIVKDLKTQSPKSYSLRQSLSSSGVKVLKFTEKDIPDQEIVSQYGDKNQDASSQLSMLNGGHAGLTDDGTVGSIAADSEGRSSDVSDEEILAREETDYSVGSTIGSTILLEDVKPVEGAMEIHKPPSRESKLLPQRNSQTLSARSKSSDSLKSLIPVPKKTTPTQVASSSVKQMKR